VGLRYNPPPGWPALPAGVTPDSGWQPDPSWPAPPPGWQVWVNDDQFGMGSRAGTTTQVGQPGAPGLPSYGAGNGFGGPDNPYAAGSQYGTGNQYGGGMPGPSGGGMPGPSGGINQPAGGTSGWAIASFILGLLGVILLGLIFGIVALRRIRRLGQRGRGLAIAGLVLSGLWIVAIVAIVVAAGANVATRSSSSGQITHQGQLGAFSLVTGDCFDNPVGARSLSRVTAIPCTQPHNAQVFAKFKLSGSSLSYPGTAQVERLATSGCNSRISSIDKSKANNAMTIRFLVPLEGSWIVGQRSVSCLIVNPATDLKSSLLKP
jgi:Domain of unknown function (DUF4190)/Septum formation